MIWVLYESDLVDTDRWVMLAIADQASAHGVTPSVGYPLLSKLSTFDRSTVMRSVVRLEREGELLVLRSGGGRSKSNRYAMTMGRDPVRLAAELGWPAPPVPGNGRAAPPFDPSGADAEEPSDDARGDGDPGASEGSSPSAPDEAKPSHSATVSDGPAEAETVAQDDPSDRETVAKTSRNRRTAPPPSPVPGPTSPTPPPPTSADGHGPAAAGGVGEEDPEQSDGHLAVIEEALDLLAEAELRDELALGTVIRSPVGWRKAKRAQLDGSHRTVLAAIAAELGEGISADDVVARWRSSARPGDAVGRRRDGARSLGAAWAADSMVSEEDLVAHAERTLVEPELVDAARSAFRENRQPEGAHP